MSVADRLSVYNDALTFCGERILASLTEAREARYVLDQAWNGGALDFCLEQGLWHFATRSVKVDYSPSITPPFGMSRVFDKPTDWIRTRAVCTDEFFTAPLLQYSDEAGFWVADLDTIYVRYISNDTSYGADFSLWTGTFAEYVSAYLATKVVLKLTQSDVRKKEADAACKRTLFTAKSKDAQGDPPSFMPEGSWTRARRTRSGRRRDGGFTSGNLY